MLKGVETVIYFVEDLQGASAWYRKALRVEPNSDTPHYVGFTVAGDEFGLHPLDGKPRPTGTPPIVAYWSVANIGDAITHFVELGASVHEAPHEVGGGIWVGAFADPFGNIVGLIQNPSSPNR